jgi:hypothetical protein
MHGRGLSRAVFCADASRRGRAAEQVWQITQGYSTDPTLPAAPLIPAGGFKEKRKGASARKARAATAAHGPWRCILREPACCVAIAPLAGRAGALRPDRVALARRPKRVLSRETDNPLLCAQVRWELTPFTSSARADGLNLMHWVKARPLAFGCSKQAWL